MARPSQKTLPDRPLDRSCLSDKIGQNSVRRGFPADFAAGGPRVAAGAPHQGDRGPAPEPVRRFLSVSSLRSAGNSARAVRSRRAQPMRRTTTRQKPRATSPVCCPAQPRQPATRRSRAEAPKSMRARATTQSRRPGPPQTPRQLAGGASAMSDHRRRA